MVSGAVTTPPSSGVLPEQSPDLERLLDNKRSLYLELLLFSPLLPGPDLLLVLDRYHLAVIREKY